MHKILKLDEVMELTKLSESTIHRKIRQGTFPRKVSLGSRAVGWINTEINEWIEALMAKRDEAHN